MMISPPFLKKNDKVCILSPAKAIEAVCLLNAKAIWESQGFAVEFGINAFAQTGYFAGTDEDRLSDFQQALNDAEVKAIVCARGGYGCIRMLEKLDWSAFFAQPKWIIGFSDITVFHLFLQAKGFKSIHAIMPLNYGQNSSEALASLFEAVQGKSILSTNKELILFPADAVIVGGNLSILYSLIGTPYLPDFTGKVLFIEDISEQLYHLDRMFFALKMSGILSQIAGLIVGGMTDMRDTIAPSGFSVKSIIDYHTTQLDIPVLLDFPAGHVDDNRAIVLG
jgi:muramoyltetrapeptide carboxypeptidase